jgi:hypothetical protein
MTRGIAILLLLLPGLAFSQGTSAWGVGAISCGKWLEWRQRDPNDEQLVQWIFGFISGHNYYSNSPDVRPPDAKAALAFVDAYCRNNPLHRVTFAGAALNQELGGKQASHQWKR